MSGFTVNLRGFSIELDRRTLLEPTDLDFRAGSSSVIVGPTGSGKSVLLRALSGLLPARSFRLGGDLEMGGIRAYASGRKAGPSAWRRIRSGGLVFVPAESALSLNPALTLEHNLSLLAPGSRPIVETRLKRWFALDFAPYARLYPDEVSGGELQRIALMMLLSRPGDLFLMDEPTVNLDRGLRGAFVDFLNAEMLSGAGRTIIMASHDLDFIRALRVDRLLSLSHGRLDRLESLPSSGGWEACEARSASRPGLSLEGLAQSFSLRGIFGERRIKAFSGLNASFERSTVHGITGPSGCGKSSMIRAILRLLDGTEGRILLDGSDLVSLKPEERGRDPEAFRPFRSRMAVVQQDSRLSFFPDMRIRDSFKRIEEARGGPDGESRQAMADYMASMGLSASHFDAYPRSLSSGEMKRMDIARALSARPEVLLLDEPFAYIDFETRSRVMKTILSHMARHETILLVVTHENFDLERFVERNHDFPALLDGKGEELRSTARIA